MLPPCNTLLPGTSGLAPVDLNQSCFCITIDQGKLDRAIATASEPPRVCRRPNSPYYATLSSVFRFA